VSAITTNTLLELVRQKVFYFLLIFGAVLIGASFFMGFLRPELQFQVMKDVSLGAMSVFTWLLAVLATAMLLPKDIEDRTLYTILAKPVPRFEYLLGKLLGVLLLLGISILVMSGLFAGVLLLKEHLMIAAAIQESKLTDPAQIAEVVRNVQASAFTWSLVPGVIAIYLKAAIFVVDFHHCDFRGGVSHRPSCAHRPGLRGGRRRRLAGQGFVCVDRAAFPGPATFQFGG